ncbi:MAG: hypothetical protein EOL97_08650 [Spirochaetia bacterium]|nr:hypothetical protein [Spirochaetia bacterium]
MKKLLILTTFIFIVVTAISQTDSQKTSYNMAAQFLTDTYATIISNDIANGYMSVYAMMPIEYSDYFIKIEMKTFVDTYSDVSLYTPWSYNSEFDTIQCILLVEDKEYVSVMYSDALNTIFFFFEWK